MGGNMEVRFVLVERLNLGVQVGKKVANINIGRGCALSGRKNPEGAGPR